MSDELEIKGGVDREILQGLDALEKALKGAATQEEAFKKKTEELGDALLESVRVQAQADQQLKKSQQEAKKWADEFRRVGEETRKAGSAWHQSDAALQRFTGRVKEGWENLSKFGEGYRNIKEPVADFAESVTRAAENLARLSSEQGRLDRTQQSLGLSFRQTQEYAGGFTSETNLATAAITLQGQGLRIHQRELDALARLAMRRAIDTGKEFSEVMENATESVTEGGEELGKLAPELLAVAGGSHTAGERLAAMVRVAERVGPATSDARTEMERFGESIQSTQRLIASGFTNEITRLTTLTSQTRDARDATEEWNTNMRAVGETAARVTALAVNGAGLVVGAVALAGASVAAVRAGVQNAITGGPGMRETFDQSTAALREFVNARVGALEALDADTEQRTSMAPVAAPTPDAATTRRDRRIRNTSNDALSGNDSAAVQALQRRVAVQRQAFADEREAMNAANAQRTRELELQRAGARTDEERFQIEQAERGLRIDELRTQNELDQRQAAALHTMREQLEAQRAAGGSEAMRNALADRIRDLRQDELHLAREIAANQQTITQATVEGARAAERHADAVKAARDAGEQRQRDIEAARRDFQRGRDADAFARSDEGRFATRGRELQSQREQREQDQRIEQMRGFNERWRDLHAEQVDITAQSMDSLSRATEAAGSALGDAWLDIVTQQASVGDALQQASAKFLLTVAKEESVEGAREIARGLSALASPLTIALAPGHFAAAAAHFGVAAATGYAGWAATPMAPEKGGGGRGASGGGAPRQDRPMSPGESSRSREAAGNTYVFQFGGGVIGTSRELAGHFADIMNDRRNGFQLSERVLTRNG